MKDPFRLALGGLYVVLFNALDEKAKALATERLWRFALDPKSDPGEAAIYRKLAEITETGWSDPTFDFQDFMTPATTY